MRTAFIDDLNRVTDGLVDMTRLAGSAIGRASIALLDGDIRLAEAVITSDRDIDQAREALDLLAIDLLARQAPVATDLRVVVTAMRMSADLERMGDLARHVAKVARLRYPDSAVPADLRGTVVQMGQVAERIVAKAGSVIASRDLEEARALEREDDAMDELHRELFSHVLADNFGHSTQTAVDLTLIGRYYERFADHAVSVARRVTFLVTGDYDTVVDREDEEDAVLTS
ncbi:MAG: phosphate signaling complex protein PhoU [Tetrasphaera jenkinsii]|jgi:phosphate transport system protein|uniref:Phosphate-specific transport system accessory protein PhoU n=1 Tax=Nostocoides jenkinsii Ben 74 TaxID=1193518 RepID=A0A077M9X9_9MICO|nr:phosphate signaling complex protein PhoU [Tetrasphaera jenkinsii]MCI1260660.1 phosphate signaling complex protein PhoU [Tetrasphaera jenkinsii]CCI51622.1 Phosphate transport system protein phoU [Tetrasphaera jenkinsii Ben 74]